MYGTKGEQKSKKMPSRRDERRTNEAGSVAQVIVAIGVTPGRTAGGSGEKRHSHFVVGEAVAPGGSSKRRGRSECSLGTVKKGSGSRFKVQVQGAGNGRGAV
jgi:hypothetical protein